MSDEMFFFATGFAQFNFAVLGEEESGFVLGIFEGQEEFEEERQIYLEFFDKKDDAIRQLECILEQCE